MRPALVLALPLAAILLLAAHQMSAPGADIRCCGCSLHSSRLQLEGSRSPALPTLAATFWALEKAGAHPADPGGGGAGLLAGAAGL